MTKNERCRLSFASLIFLLLGTPQPGALAETPNVVWEGSGKSGYLYSVAFSPDGQMVATGDGVPPVYDSCTGTLLYPGEGTVRLWNANDGTLLQSATADQTRVASVAFSPDAQQLASGSSSNLKLWSLPDLASFRALSDYPWNEIRSVAFSPDGRFLAAGLAGNGNAVKVYGSDGTFRTLPFSSWVIALTFSSDSQFLAVANATAIQIYRTSDWQFERVISPQQGPNGPSALAFSPNGETFASSGPTVKLWRISDGTLVRELPAGGQLAFSADGQTLLIAGPPIEFWKVSDGSLLKTYDEPRAFILSVAFSPDNTLFGFTQPTGDTYGSPGIVVVARNPLIP